MLTRTSLVLVGLLATSVAAQTPQPAVSVTGVVFDSVANAPLGGAVVQATMVDAAVKSDKWRNFSAIADAAGRYRLEGLPRGRFAIGFQHSALSALGLDASLSAFEIRSDTTLVINLSIPGGARVKATMCPGAPAGDGLLAGMVLSAQHATLGSAFVTLAWTEIGVVAGKIQTIPRRLRVPVDVDGNYLACGLASESPLAVEVSKPGYRTIVGEITVPEGSTLRRDFLLADTARTQGGTAIIGRLVHADGAPVSAGHASIDALDLDAVVANGAFTLAGVPPGTWLVEARVIGYEPKAAFVDVTEGTPASLRIAVDQKVQLLEAVTVVGKASAEIKKLKDIADRRLVSGGTQFMPGNVWLKSAQEPMDVLRAARGFFSGQPRGCTERVSIMGAGPRKELKVYLDGALFEKGDSAFVNIRGAVPMRDILAIEAYPDYLSIPPIWRTSDACAVIAVWTKR